MIQVMNNTKEIETLQTLIAELTPRGRRPRASFKKKHTLLLNIVAQLNEAKDELDAMQFQSFFNQSDTTRDRLRKAFAFLRKTENGKWWARMDLCETSNEWCGKDNAVWWDSQEKDRLEAHGIVNIFWRATGRISGNATKAFKVLTQFGLEVKWDGTSDGCFEVKGNIS